MKDKLSDKRAQNAIQMKKSIELLNRNGIICRHFTWVKPGELGSRTRTEIYMGVETDDYYCAVMTVRRKSKIMGKEAKELMRLHARLEALKGTKISRRYLLLFAPICSKAYSLLQDEGWLIIKGK
jgi:hypothetical protein